jgi:hypothetical protein
MSPRIWMYVLPFASLLSLVLASEGSALAANTHAETAAQGALKKVVVDYRAKRYAAAAAKLEKALRGCGDDQCAPETKAALLRDLGTMQLRQGDTASESTSFDAALALAPDLALNSRYDRPDVRAAWDEAKQRAADAAKASHPEPEPANAEPSSAATPPESPPAPAPDETVAEPSSAEAPSYARLWIGVAGAFDLVVLPSGTDFCKLTSRAAPANSSFAYCTNPDGTDFPSRATPAQNDALLAGHAGTIKGGLQIGDVRAMLSVDYALSPSFLLGVRGGYVLNSYPGAAAIHDKLAFGKKLHAELRATYLFGRAPLTRIGFAPMVLLAGGISEFDGHLASNVTQEGVGPERVNVWITDGPWFVTLGAGARYQLSLRAALTAVVRLNVSFPDNAVLPTAGPEVGFQYGF